jgi:Skp family chaperone for outer membrane proteins
MVLSALLVSAALLTGTASAQQDQSSGGIVAVLDVAKVFKENREFESGMATIKSTADQLKAAITQQGNDLKQKAAGLQQYEVGSPERNQMESELAQEQARIRAKAHQAEMDLLSKEAGVYYNTYEKMQSVLASVANEYSIALILRHDSEPIDANDRNEVVKGVNRSIVYQNQRDITSIVIKRMATDVASAGGPTTH